MANKLSIIVHTEKEPAALSRCLAALVAQRLTTRDLEIVVVDRRKRLAVRQLVAWWNAALTTRRSATRLSYVAPRSEHQSNVFLLRLCSGDIVAQIDETAEPDAHWAARGVASVLERESSTSRAIFPQYESFHRRDELLTGEHEVKSQAIASSANGEAMFEMPRPFITLADHPIDREIVEPRRRELPSLRFYFAALLVVVAASVLLAKGSMIAVAAVAAALVAIIGIAATSPNDVLQRKSWKPAPGTTEPLGELVPIVRRKS